MSLRLASFERGYNLGSRIIDGSRDRYYTRGLSTIMSRPGQPVPAQEGANIFDPSSWGIGTGDMPEAEAGSALNPDGSVDFEKLSRFALRSGRQQDAINFMKLGIADEKRTAERKEMARRDAYRADLQKTFGNSKGLPDFSRAAELAMRHGMASEAANFAKFGMAQADWKEGKRVKNVDEFAMRLGAAFNPNDAAGSLPHISRLVQQHPELAADLFSIPKAEQGWRQIVGMDSRTGPDGQTVWAPLIRNAKTGTIGPMTNMGGAGKGEAVLTIQPERFLRYLKPYLPKPTKKAGKDKWGLTKDGTAMINEATGQMKPVPTSRAGRRKTAMETMDDILDGLEKKPGGEHIPARVKSTVGSVLDSLEKKGVPATAVVNEAVNILLRDNAISKDLITNPSEEMRATSMNALEQYLIEHYHGKAGLGGAAEAGAEAGAANDDAAAAGKPDRPTRPEKPAEAAADKPKTPTYGWMKRMMEGDAGTGADQTGALGEMPLDSPAAPPARAGEAANAAAGLATAADEPPSRPNRRARPRPGGVEPVEGMIGTAARPPGLSAAERIEIDRTAPRDLPPVRENVREPDGGAEGGAEGGEQKAEVRDLKDKREKAEQRLAHYRRQAGDRPNANMRKAIKAVEQQIETLDKLIEQAGG